MEKRCSLGLFCFAVFIAFDPAFATQIEAVTENGKPLIRKSSASQAARRYSWKTRIVTTIFWIGEQPGKQSGAESDKLLGQTMGEKLRRI